MRRAASAVLAAAALTACTSSVAQTVPAPSPQASPSVAVTESPSAAEATPSTAPSPSAVPSIAKLVISSLPFHGGEVGVAYAAVVLGAAGGTPPYTWSISAGALPGGLGLSGSSVSGTPASGGSFTFTVRVADSAGQAAGATKSITIAARLAVRGLCSTQCNVEIGCVTVCGHFGAQAGGVAPFRYALTGGTLPTRMGLSGLSVTGAFPPPPVGALFLPWKFQVTVTDAYGVTGSVAAVYYDYTHIAWTVTTATCAATVAPFNCTTTQLKYAYGTPGSTVTKVVPTNYSVPLPLGTALTATASGGTVTVTVSGKSNYSGLVTLVLIDSDPCSTSGGCQSGPATVTVRV